MSTAIPGAESTDNKELHVHRSHVGFDDASTVKAREEVGEPFLNIDATIKTGLTTSPSTKSRFSARPHRQSHKKEEDVGDVSMEEGRWSRNLDRLGVARERGGKNFSALLVPAHATLQWARLCFSGTHYA